MAKQSCCHKKKLRRGLWSPEEDEKLMNHIAKYGHGCWSSVPKLAGLERCGKSCRLRWINYLRPDLKRGTFSQEEEDLIIQLHSMLGNKWSQIAAQLPGRTDNEVKNLWNSYIKKKLRERGIDPATHKPLLADASSVGDSAASASSRAAVFCDATELSIPTTTPLIQSRVAEPLLDGGVVSNNKLIPLDSVDWATAAVPPSQQLSSGYDNNLQVTGCHFDMDALALQQQQDLVKKIRADDAPEHSNNLLLQAPWLGLGPNTLVDSSYNAGTALDELRWSDYFDGAFQAAASQQGALQLQGPHQCVYGGGKDDDNVAAVAAVQIDVVHGLSNWC